MPGDGEELASQPTLSRFENAIDIPSLVRLRDVLIDQFLDAFNTPPARLTFDIDAFDDPAHGAQQLTLFHGDYEQNQDFPLVITNAETGLVVALSLRHGTAHAALGADDDLEHLVGRMRERWPDVDIEVRADRPGRNVRKAGMQAGRYTAARSPGRVTPPTAGFGVPDMYEVCERLRVWYTLGFAMNARLKTLTEDLQTQATKQYEATGEKQRLFTVLPYQAGGWDRERTVVVKAEHQAAGPNRRAVVTNRPGAPIVPQGVYDDYVQRGESENRNKELKLDLCGERLSDHRFMANLFRLHLHATALNLLIHLRRTLPEPAADEPRRPAPVPDAESPRAPTGAELRRAQPATWRLRLIKVAAEVLVSARRVLVRLSSAWPSLPTWRLVLQQVQRC